MNNKELFESPGEMLEQLDTFLFYLRKRYFAKKGTEKEKTTLLSFIITDMDVVFEKTDTVRIRTDYQSNTLFIVSPCVPDKERESRRLFLLNYFSSSLKRVQLSATIDLFCLLGRAGKELLGKEEWQ